MRITGGTNIAVRNAYATNSKNAFRASGDSRNLVFENIEAYNSKDIYDGMDPNYLNGDGFIFELDVANVTLRNIISANHWDAGFDIKASDVLMENVIAFGNKNHFKTWGNNITIRSSLSYRAKRQPRSDGSTVEGNGITVESGTTKLVNVTLVDNEDYDARIHSQGTLRMENCIVARRPAPVSGLFKNDGGLFTSDRVLWYEAGRDSPTLRCHPPTCGGDPQFIDWDLANYHLQSTSLAIDAANSTTDLSSYDLDLKKRVVGERSDLGAYEYQGGTVPEPNPTPTPTPEPEPVPVPQPEPSPQPETLLFTGLSEGETVSGKIYFQPNPELLPNVKSVIYYLDGKMKWETSASPFTFGSASGYDTNRIKNKTYVLKAVYTNKDGSGGEFSVTFTVKNFKSGSASAASQTPSPSTLSDPVATTSPQTGPALLGLNQGQTVGGTIFVQPNLEDIARISEAIYFLNGKKVNKAKGAPFFPGGTKGLDTTKLKNGAYELVAVYATAQGEELSSVTFNVFNVG